MSEDRPEFRIIEDPACPIDRIYLIPDPAGWHLSPDCRDGNCSKCPGDAWDMLKDMPTSCTCHHHEPV